MAISGTSLATSLGINGGICVIALIVFSVLRIKPVTRRFYCPKRYDPEVKRKPRALPSGLFSWISPVLLYPEDEVLRVAGMDVVVMARLLMYGWVLFAFCTFWCCALLMPINGTAGFLYSVPKTAPPKPAAGGAPAASSKGGGDPSVLFTDLDLLSASNVRPGNPRFWAHLITAYVVSAVALTLLLMFSRDVSRLRARYISTLPRGGPTHSVLITDIPCVDGLGAKPSGKASLLTKLFNRGAAAAPGMGGKDIAPAGAGAAGEDGHFAAVPDEDLDPWALARKGLASGDADSMVRQEVESAYGARSVAAVNVVSDTRKLDPLLAKYNATKRQLEDLTDDYIGKSRRKVEIKQRKQVSLLPAGTPKWAKDKYNVGAKPVKVDALEYLPQQLDHLLAEMKTERGALQGERMPAAFVTFNDRYTANTAATGLHSYDETAWRVQPAPDADEVIWANLPMRANTRVKRALLMGVAFVALLILYLPLTAAIQAVVNLDNAKKIPGLGLVASIPFVTQVLQGILPGLVLKIFLIILPPILGAMARFEGKTSLSQVDFSVVNRFFVFQVFATFIYQFLVGSALSNVQRIIADPTGQIVSLLGVSAAQTSTFFMSFIMINALAVGMGLLRIVGLVLFFVFSRLAGTERARYRLWAKQPYAFGANVANHTITILLGLAFTCLAPLIAPFCLLYFTLALLAQKYQLLYVVTLPYDAAGRMWINCFHQIMVGIYFLQVMLLAVLLVKTFPYALLILPLLLFTLVFHVVVIGRFKRPWTLMSLKEAALLDGRDHGGVSGAEAEALRLKYLSPAFKVDEAEHAKLLDEARQVDLHLKGQPSALKLDALEEDVADVVDA